MGHYGLPSLGIHSYIQIPKVGDNQTYRIIVMCIYILKVSLNLSFSASTGGCDFWELTKKCILLFSKTVIETLTFALLKLKVTDMCLTLSSTLYGTGRQDIHSLHTYTLAFYLCFAMLF